VAIRWQIALSALAFATIHLGYIGSEGLGVFWPLVGTATLGGILAWSVVEGRGSILPAVVAHVAILVVVQPWLALAT
jgi:membrane protease YdiL (CAAX protease family)